MAGQGALSCSCRRSEYISPHLESRSCYGERSLGRIWKMSMRMRRGSHYRFVGFGVRTWELRRGETW